MNAPKRVAGCLAVAAAALCSSAFGQQAPDGHMVMTKPDELKWAPSPSLPGAMATVIEGPISQAVPFTLRLKLPANYKIQPHYHPGIEHVTVLSGTFKLGHGEKFDEAKVTPLPAGSVAIMQPKTPHFAMTDAETVLQLHGTGPWSVIYVNPDDDPVKKN